MDAHSVPSDMEMISLENFLTILYDHNQNNLNMLTMEYNEIC